MAAPWVLFFVAATCRLLCAHSIRDELSVGESRSARDLSLVSRQASSNGAKKATLALQCSPAPAVAYGSLGLNAVLIVGIIALGYKFRQASAELEEEKDQHMKDTHDFLERLQRSAADLDQEQNAHKNDNTSFLGQLDEAAHDLESEQVAHNEDNVVAENKLDREKLEHEYDGYRLKGKHAQYLMKVKRLEQQLERNVANVKAAQQIADTARDDMNKALTGMDGVRTALATIEKSSPDAEKDAAHWVWRMPNVCGGRAKVGSKKSNADEAGFVKKVDEVPNISLTIGEASQPAIEAESIPQFRGSVEQTAA